MKIFDPHITGSLSVSASANIQGDLHVTGTIYGNAQITGQVDNAISASHASKYLLTSSFNDRVGTLATTGSNIFTEDQIISGSIFPSKTDTYDLGSPSKQWRDLFLSSGSLYINGQQVLSTTGDELRITTDAGESLKLIETDSDTITLQTENGDITLTTSGNGNIELDAPIQIAAGNKIISSDGNSIVFGDGLVISGSIEILGTVDGVDVSTLQSTFNTYTSSNNTTNTTQNNRLNSIETETGSLDGRITTIEGGLEFTGSNVTVKGNLLVKGTETRVNSTTVDISDNIISLNGSGASSAGIEVRDVTSPGLQSGSFIWDSTNNRWVGGPKGSEERFLTNTDLTGLDGRLDSLEIKTGSLDTTNTTQNNRLNSIETKTGSIETVNNTQNNRLSSLETKTGSLDGDISTLDGRLDSLEIKTGSIETVNTTQNNRLVSIESKTGSYITGYTETDPIFTASPSAGITTTNINNWNTSYGWGDHSIEGYLKTYNDEYTTGATFNSGNGVITFTRNDGDTYTVDVDGRYLTSFTETDTLDSVTDRGATTTNDISVGDLLSTHQSEDNATTKGEMLSYAVAKFKPHSTNSGTLAIAQVDNGNSVGLQFTNGAGTSNWDMSLQPFGGNVGINKVDPQGSLHVYSGTSERFLISGDVHIQGSTDLNINGNSRRLSFTSGTGTIRTTTENSLYLQTNSTTAITIDSSQNVTLNNDLIVSKGTTTKQAHHSLYIGGDGLASNDASIYIGNRGDGTGYGYEFYYYGVGSGNDNKLIIRSENLGSPVDMLTFNANGTATFANTITSIGGNSTNWNTAYEWGNHASVGYLTSYNNEYTTGATFNTGNGIITFTRNDGDTYTVDIDNRYLQLDGGTLTGDLTLSGVTPQINFNGTSDAGIDMAIKATPEGLDFYEPEDVNKIHFQILDDIGVNAVFGLQVGGTNVITSSRVLQNVSGNISMFTNDSNYLTAEDEEYTTGATFNGSNGIITFTRNDGDTYTVDISSTLTDVTVTGGTYNDSTQTLSLTKSDGNTVSVTGFAIESVKFTTGATFNNSNGVITFTNNDATTYNVDIDGRYLTGYTETDTLETVTGRGAVTSTSVRFQNDLNYFGFNNVTNEAEIVINTGNFGSPQIGFTENGDASWAIGVDDQDNNFKIHGVESAAIPTIDNLTTPLFEVTTAAGTAYLNGSRIFYDGYHPNADKWTTARTISLTGEASGSISLDGTSNVSINVTLDDNALNNRYVQIGSRFSGDASSITETSYRLWDVSTSTDKPLDAADGLILTGYWDSSNWATQQYHDFHTNNLYLRSKQSGTWQSTWDKVYHDTYHPYSDNAGLLDNIDSSQFLRSDADDSFTGNLTTGANNHITFGPNTTWGSYLRVGGNGYTATGTEMASVVTTDGNLHLDAADSDNAIYLNYYAGTTGIMFGNGDTGIRARMDSNGNLYRATTTTNIVDTYLHTGNYTSTLDNRYVNKAGDTMTGDLTLSSSGQGWLKGYDPYHSIKFRAGTDNKTEYYEYGGTLAAGLGHKFFTGGTTAQTLKLQIADDGSYFTGNLGIGTNGPDTKVHIYEESASPVLLTLHNKQNDIVSNGTQGNFIDFKMTDGNATYTPQARIGMIVEDSDGDGGVISEGTGNFVVYTGEGTNSAGDGILTERLRVTDKGKVKTTDSVIVNNRSALSILHWSSTTTSTGAIKITIPGSHGGNWSMMVLRITTYEYNSNNHTVYYVSGHDWTSGWYNNGVTKNGDSDKNISLGYDTNKDYIIVGDVSSTWAYGHVTVDVIAHPSFYNTSMDISKGWEITQTTSVAGITINNVTNRKVLTTSDEGSGNGIDSDTIDGLQASQFLRSDADDATGSTVKTWLRGAIDAGSAATLQINGFQRTGNIYLHDGGNAPNTSRASDYINNQSGDLYWNKDGTGQGKVWTSLNDGSGSGLDSDTVDGLQASQFLRSDQTDTMTGHINMADNFVINRPFAMIENASPQWILLCANAGGNDVNGTISIDRTSGNYQAAQVNVIVTSGSSTMFGGTLSTLQVLQQGEDYRLVSVTYGGINYIAIKYSGNTYPMTTPAKFTGRIVDSTGNAFTVVNTGITNETQFGGNSEAYYEVDNFNIMGNMNVSGEVTAYYSSDSRLKKNTTEMVGVLDKLKNIGGYTFEWDETKQNVHKGNDIGVIAQEIESEFPELVVERDNGYKAVKYEKLTAVLIQALKEQQIQIDELKSKLK